MSPFPGPTRPVGMDIAVVGGPGLLGRQVVERLRERGHVVRVLSRRAPEYRVDLTTGTGLAQALAGCDVVVDASDNSASTKAARRTLVEGTRVLLEAEARAGVGHHVCVSIVNCDEAPVGYYQVKADQERLVEGSVVVPWTIVRATQFHEFVVSAFLAPLARLGLHVVPGALIQPVATVEAAGVIAGVAGSTPSHGMVEVTGPEIVDLRELGRVWRRLTGRRAVRVPIRLPGAMGRALRAGVLTAPANDVPGAPTVHRGELTFQQWLRQTSSSSR